MVRDIQLFDLVVFEGYHGIVADVKNGRYTVCLNNGLTIDTERSDLTAVPIKDDSECPSSFVEFVSLMRVRFTAELKEAKRQEWLDQPV